MKPKKNYLKYFVFKLLIFFFYYIAGKESRKNIKKTCVTGTSVRGLSALVAYDRWKEDAQDSIRLRLHEDCLRT